MWHTYMSSAISIHWPQGLGGLFAQCWNAFWIAAEHGSADGSWRPHWVASCKRRGQVLLCICSLDCYRGHHMMHAHRQTASKLSLVTSSFFTVLL